MLIQILFGITTIICLAYVASSFIVRHRSHSWLVMDPIVVSSDSFGVALQNRPLVERKILTSSNFGVREPELGPISGKLQNGAVDAAIAIDSMVFLAGAVAQWDRVDDNVLQAVSHLTHTDVDSFGDLYAAVHERGYDLASDGFFYSLRGHIGEWEAIKHFSEFAPNMATSAYQPGWDVAFGDNTVANVKVTADATETLASHFDRYPDIPVILNADAAHIPHDALHFDPAAHFDSSMFEHAHVIVDPLLTAAHTGEEAHSAIDALQNPVPFHFPWITMAVSLAVEGNLVARGHTTIGRAAKNTTVTTTSVVVGGTVGKLAGAAVVGLIFPPAAIFGMIAGGILGSFAGREVAKEVNLMPLNEAESKLRSATTRLQLSLR